MLSTRHGLRLMNWFLCKIYMKGCLWFRWHIKWGTQKLYSLRVDLRGCFSITLPLIVFLKDVLSLWTVYTGQKYLVYQNIHVVGFCVMCTVCSSKPWSCHESLDKSYSKNSSLTAYCFLFKYLLLIFLTILTVLCLKLWISHVVSNLKLQAKEKKNIHPW